ncbi:inorganic phosphate transporter [Glutamicibacter sp. MNS18]|uniref:inorganic phosphate transporter n=1 Tax=Glutamicibacter sp. MNS18 TaxID=2989817 RepID=UPI00223588B0|nr:inorganic phosphate transporter [Glutamicibacter sp. MNS18]MCW4467293.1 inorganic phosphate transporter [Glutamicibacter sp. MNS18]
MALQTILVGVALVLALGYTWLNGFRDASTAVAAAVRTRALTPGIAVAVAAVFAFLGTLASSSFGFFLVSRLDVSLGSGVPGLLVLVCGLVTAIGWGLFCWWRGMPTSSTQGLLSGLAGATGAAAILGSRSMSNPLDILTGGVLLPLLVTPIVAYSLSYLMVYPVTWLIRHDTARDVNARSRAGQALGACAVALGLGLQDGQRSGAMLTLILLTAQYVDSPAATPWAIQLTAATFLSLGVLFGGWRIAHTLQHRLVKFDPMRGMVAQGVAAGLLYVGALLLHLPISTNQSVSSAIVGAGANQPFETVSWRNVLRVAGHWIATPIACVAGGVILTLAAYPLTLI